MTVMKFKTPSGYKTIRIKKSARPKEGIKTGRIGSVDLVSIVKKPDDREEKNIMPVDQKPDEPHKESALMSAKGIAIPDIKNEEVYDETLNKESPRKINIKYPLVPQNPKRGEKVFAYAHIFFSNKLNEIVYLVVEPKLEESDKKILQDINQYIQEKLNVSFFGLKKKEAINYIDSLVEKAFGYFKIRGIEKKRSTYKYYITRNFIGLGKIDPLMQDRRIEDISCDGINIPLYVYHRNPKVGSVRTNLVFSSKESLDKFTTKLSERSGKSISVAKPLLDGSLPDGSRVQATLGSDIARRGSNFTIRKFTDRPLTPVDMIKFGTCDLKMMAYYWFMVENGFSFLVSGGTASGKTSLLNVLSLFIKPQMKIVSIEDTAELRIPHAHWVPEVARSPISEEGKVDMFELLRESLRQRPDYIIVGEVRGKEAYVLFQQMATGHPGLSTIHAENFTKLMDRLTSPPISLPPGLIQNLDLILFLKRIKKGRIYLRRVFSAAEVVGYDFEKKAPIINELFSWNAAKNEFVTINKSTLMKKIADSTGLSVKEIRAEIYKRAEVLRWMVRRDVTDYRKVAAIINMFYLSPDFLMQRIGSSGASV